MKSKLSAYIQDYENNKINDVNVNTAIQYICNEMVFIFAKSMIDMHKVVINWHESQIKKYNKNTNNFSKLETQLDKEYTEYYRYQEFLDACIYIMSELNNTNESVKLLSIKYNLNDNEVSFSNEYLNNFLNSYVTSNNTLLVERYNS